MSASCPTSGNASRAGAAFLTLALVWVTVFVAVPARANGEAVEQLAPGLQHAELHRDGIVAHVARLSRGAPLTVRAALAAGSVGAESREPTSSICRRERAAVCVNADFAACPSCREVFGGFASGGVVRRSFHPHHDQFSVTPEGFASSRPQWRAELTATLRWPAEETPPAQPLAPASEPVPAREEVHRIEIHVINRAEEIGAVLYSADWGAPTMAVEGRRELVVAIDADVPSGAHEAALLELRSAGGIASGQVAVRADEEAASAFWEAWTATTAPDRRLVLEATPPQPLVESVGAHPVLLQDGQRMPLDRSDGKVSHRHPRTLVAWTPAGDLLLVTIDGRQPGWSHGATLAEATDLLVDLGASDALNLDGGGSTTFVAPCSKGTCVRNRPSDGRERAVPAVLLLVPDEGVAVRHPVPAERVVAPAALVAAPDPAPAPTALEAQGTPTVPSEPEREPEPDPAPAPQPAAPPDELSAADGPTPPPAPALAAAESAPPPPRLVTSPTIDRPRAAISTRTRLSGQHAGSVTTVAALAVVVLLAVATSTGALVRRRWHLDRVRAGSRSPSRGTCGRSDAKRPRP